MVKRIILMSGLCASFVPFFAHSMEQNSHYLMLEQAVVANSAENVRQAVRLGINLQQSSVVKNLIFLAVLLEKSKALDALLDAGAPIDINHLQYAVSVKNMKYAKSFAARIGVDLNTIYFTGYHAYHGMTQGSTHLNTMGVALKELSRINAIAIEKKQDCRMLVDELLSHGYENSHFYTNVWRYAIHFDALEQIIDLFIKHGLSPNQEIDCARIGNPMFLNAVSGTQGMFATPLLIAITMNAIESVKILLEVGADSNQKTPNPFIKRTLADFLLSSNGAIITHTLQPSTELRTPLVYAIFLGNRSIVELLIKHGACIQAPGTDYKQNQSMTNPINSNLSLGQATRQENTKPEEAQKAAVNKVKQEDILQQQWQAQQQLIQAEEAMRRLQTAQQQAIVKSNSVIQQPKQEMRKCLVCTNDKPATEFYSLSCGHEFCINCLNTIADKDANERLCPDQACKQPIKRLDVTKIGYIYLLGKTTKALVKVNKVLNNIKLDN